ncbi:MAG TPA: YdcF family protein [Bacteroidales bacterium]|nr:YdcF family protein [Bacteroidales bacterium]
MFFILSKLLFFLINPIVWVLSLIVTGLLLKKRKEAFYLSAAILLFIFSNAGIFQFVSKKWEIESLPADSVKKHYTYAVVLGGMASGNTENGKMLFGESIDRILQAIILYKQGKIDTIFITGGSGLVWGQSKKEAPIIRKFCTDMGVKENCILIEDQSRNTHENAIMTKALLNSCQGRILLITSAFHMRRSMGCFKKSGFEFDILSTNPLCRNQLYLDDYFIPKTEIIEKWGILLKEITGSIVYKLAGYI